MRFKPVYRAFRKIFRGRWLRLLRPSTRLHKPASYADYVNAQIQTNHRKLDRVWLQPEEADCLAEYIKSSCPEASFGICHGVRNGWEVRALRERLGIEVLGTEIAPTAGAFEHVLQLDFHNIKEDWVGRADFIYSNSFDHSYDPKYCLSQWVKCLKPEGICLLHWSPQHDAGRCNASDCFQASRRGYQELIEAGHVLHEVVEMPGGRSRCLFVVKRRRAA